MHPFHDSRYGMILLTYDSPWDDEGRKKFLFAEWVVVLAGSMIGGLSDVMKIDNVGWWQKIAEAITKFGVVAWT